MLLRILALIVRDAAARFARVGIDDARRCTAITELRAKRARRARWLVRCLVDGFEYVDERYTGCRSLIWHATAAEHATRARWATQLVRDRWRVTRRENWRDRNPGNQRVIRTRSSSHQRRRRFCIRRSFAM